MPQVSFKQQPNFPELEEQIMKWWQDNDSFRQSVNQRPSDHTFVFYDGPPFATGMPHYGHLLASTTKDVIPRYWTMKGYRVNRVWGWDCHGLPIENMIEKQLDIKGGKKGIEALGIDHFNQACRSEVLRLDKEWEKVVNRLGRWVDMEHNYKTMDATFMESVWWGFQQLHQKDLIYQGRKVVLYCPRCATPLSNFEIAMDNSYQDVTDDSVFVIFHLTHDQAQANEYIVAWTTTPWTLPGNVGLAVKADAIYVQVLYQDKLLWLAQDRVAAVFGDQTPEVKTSKSGAELVGWTYTPLYTDLPIGDQPAYFISTADFVSLTDGTGVVHTAAMYGEDDYALAQQVGLPCVPMLDEEGKFLPFVSLVGGLFYKKANQPILEDLTTRNLILKTESITHSYPFCYRCATPLYYNAVPAWFVDVQKLKQQLIELNEDINWFPDHLKHGRFLHGLETAPDWNISRSRYWGTPMPIWEAQTESGPVRRVIGSVAELTEWAVHPAQVSALTDLHREFLDAIEIYVDDNRTLVGKRIPEVFDCWVESGSMPFASVHYPFANRDFFESNYPAQFVSEYIAQTRAWFYTMHVLSVGIFGKPSFQNVLTTGTILAEDGSKMSKSKHNYPDPQLLIDKYGSDSLRLYLMSSTVMKGENLNFSEQEVADIRRRVFVTWWNMTAFFQSFCDQTVDITMAPTQPSRHILDQWLVSTVNYLIASVTESLDNYDVVSASRKLIEFVNDLSTWYLRLSRDRLRQKDNHDSQHVFGWTLYTLAQLFAPFAPFLTEVLHHNLVSDQTSIHHSDWPLTQSTKRNVHLEQTMTEVKKLVELIRAARQSASIKLRQPLAKVTLTSSLQQPAQELLQVIATEVNVKEIIWHQGQTQNVELDTILTDELIAEGEARELARSIQTLRKKAGLTPEQTVAVQLPSWPPEWKEWLQTKTNASSLVQGDELKLLD